MRVRTTIMSVAIAVGGLVAAAAPAAAAEPYACAARHICVWDTADGLGESWSVMPQWEGGASLVRSGWNKRASSIQNNMTSSTVYLYSGSDETCWALLGEFPAGTGGPLPAAADNNLDSVYWKKRTLDLCP
ncbi:peptidase inhibitor family I36 protein [Actinomycetes bacterium KLBMP 9759]